MSTNLTPFSSDGGFGTTGNVVAGNVLVVGNIEVSGAASPAPSLNGFSSVNAVNLSASGNITSGSLRAGTGNNIATIDQASGNLRISAGFTTTVIPPTAYTLSVSTDYATGDLIVGVGGDFKVLRATVTSSWSANANTAFSLLTTSASNVRVNSAGVGYSAVTPLTSVNYFAGNTSYILTFASDVTFLSNWNVDAIQMTVGGSSNANDNVVVYTGGVASSPVLSINGVTKDIQAYGALDMGGKIVANAASITATGNISGNNILASTRVITTPTSIFNLAATPGSRAFVNDGNVSAFSSFGTSVGGGGSNIVPVWSDGSGWYVG